MEEKIREAAQLLTGPSETGQPGEIWDRVPGGGRDLRENVRRGNVRRESAGSGPTTGASCGRTPGKRAPDGRAQGAPDRNGPGCQETGGQKATVETEKEKKSYDQDHIVGRSYSSSSGGRVFMEEIQPVERAGEPAGILWNPTRRTAGCYCQRPDHGAPGNDIRRESLSAV